MTATRYAVRGTIDTAEGRMVRTYTTAEEDRAATLLTEMQDVQKCQGIESDAVLILDIEAAKPKPRFVVDILGVRYFRVRDTRTGLDAATGDAAEKCQDIADDLNEGRLSLDARGRIARSAA